MARIVEVATDLTGSGFSEGDSFMSILVMIGWFVEGYFVRFLVRKLITSAIVFIFLASTSGIKPFLVQRGSFQGAAKCYD